MISSPNEDQNLTNSICILNIHSKHRIFTLNIHSKHREEANRTYNLKLRKQPNAYTDYHGFILFEIRQCGMNNVVLKLGQST